MDRIILHSDMNSFYASVECLYHPELSGKPVAVVGDMDQRHGIVLAKNQLAKIHGVSTGEAIWQAEKKCPGLVTLTARYELYMRFSKLARKIYERYTDRIESFGLDECWLDVTGNGWNGENGERLANELRHVIKSELGLTVSVGVSFNKIFAKLGSDLKKPDAVTILSRDNFKEKIYPLPASDLLYVGPATTRKLARYGINTIGAIANSDPNFLHSILGKWGETLWCFASGHDISPVSKSDFNMEIKSVGNSMTTYRDMCDYNDVWKVIMALSENVAKRLREQGFRSSLVQIGVKDNSFNFFERQAKLSKPTFTSSELAESAMELFKKNYNFNVPLRSVGVRACNLCDSSRGIQLDFFSDESKRKQREKIEVSVDQIRKRFGGLSLVRASLLNDDLTTEQYPLTHVIHPVAFTR